MTTRSETLDRYMEGFRRSDHGMILSCLTDDVVVVTGTGMAHHREAGRLEFAYNDLFTFRGDLIAQVDSYVVPLS